MLSTNRTPALTKNEMRANTVPMRSSPTRGRTSSSTAIAVDIAKAISCTGVAPASCRWYEQMLTGFHLGTCSTVYATVSAISRIDGAGGNAYVPRERYSLMMSFCVVPWSTAASTSFSSAVTM